MGRAVLTSHQASPSTTDNPLQSTDRVAAIDAVRGFALFGVLLVNMYSFGGDSIAWDGTWDRLCFAIKHAFFESKSWTLFSLLFGFSFATQMQRWASQAALPRMLRRLAILLAFGSAHALLYDGDILRLYAELGLVLLVAHRLPTAWLLTAAVALLAVFPIAHLLAPDREPDDLHAVASVEEAREELLFEQEESVYATGSLSEVIAYNAEDLVEIPWADIAWPDSGLTVLALFLLGMCLARSGVLEHPADHRPLFTRVGRWGLGVGVLAVAGEAALGWAAGYDAYRQNEAGVATTLCGDLLFTSGTLLLAAGYAATLFVAADTASGRRWLSPLAAVGRMGLTVYLTQTLAFTTLFYGYGVGQAYRLGPLTITMAAIVIFSVQVVACSWWLRHFPQGPAEWLWRRGTYAGRPTPSA